MTMSEGEKRGGGQGERGRDEEEGGASSDNAVSSDVISNIGDAELTYSEDGEDTDMGARPDDGGEKDIEKLDDATSGRDPEKYLEKLE